MRMEDGPTIGCYARVAKPELVGGWIKRLVCAHVGRSANAVLHQKADMNVGNVPPAVSVVDVTEFIVGV